MLSLAEGAAKPVGLIGVTLVFVCGLPPLIRVRSLINSFFARHPAVAIAGR